MLRTITIVALASLASAQISGLSSQCQGALAGIVADADANACLKPSDLIPLATASGNTSVVPIVDKWATDVCSSAPCSNQTLAKVVNLITTGCQAEISGGAQGVDPTTLATTITPLVQQYYPTVRKVVCLKNGNTLCLTETLRNIEGTTGPLTLNSIMGMIMGGRIPDIPKNVTCTDCIKAAYNVINTDVPSVTSDAAPELQSQCGASFTDGNTPSTISQSAVDTAAGSSNQGNGASILLASGLGVSALTVVSTIMAFF